MKDNASQLRKEHRELTDFIARPDAFNDPNVATKTKRHAELNTILKLLDSKTTKTAELQEAEKLARSSDTEMVELAKAEVNSLGIELSSIDDALDELLAPKDPNNTKNAIIEIRAGAGGDEASLFASELYRMYARYCEKNHLKLELSSESPSEAGGFKEVIFEVKGKQVYGQLKYESGVHRVQRIPVTESQGRIHTSTATVAVMPEAQEKDLEIKPSDLRIDTFRASGHGGQSVNTTDSAVRITHTPSGVIVSMQDEKSQIKNRDKAMKILRTRLLAHQTQKRQSEESEVRLKLIGTGDRSEKIRTYNYPQDRITDHRIGFSRSNLPDALDGNIEDLIEALGMAERELAKK